MKNFKDFKNSGSGGKTDNKGENPEDIIKQYQGKSKNELFEALLLEVTKAKSEGKFDKEQLLAFVKQVAPFLNKEESDRLQELINKIS